MHTYASAQSEQFGGCLHELDRICLGAILVAAIAPASSSPTLTLRPRPLSITNISLAFYDNLTDASPAVYG